MLFPMKALVAIAPLLLVGVNGHPPAPPGSAIKRTIGSWQYRGCYVDFGPRIFNFRFDIPGGNTAERCTQLCADNGYGLAGLEYANECWCDNYNIFGELPIKPDSQCNFACPGDETEWCGAGNRLVVYENTAATPPSVDSCINWRVWYTFQNTRLQAIPKTGSGTPVNLYGMQIPNTAYRLMTTCPTGCTYTDYFNFGLIDGVLSSYDARAVSPNVGGTQTFLSTWPTTFPGYNAYCAKPNPLSPYGGFVGFPLLSVNGDTGSWALCPNTAANGRLDVIYSPVAGNAQYDHTQCNEVYIQILPYSIDYSNYGP